MNLSEEHYTKVWRRKIEMMGSYERRNLRVEATMQILRTGRRLLDIGCGDGLLGTLASAHFAEVYGVDIADQALDLAKQRGIRTSKVNLNEQSLPFENDFFDSITCLSTLQLLYDIVFVLKECYRVLRPDGEIIVSVPNMRAYWRIFKLAVLGEFPRTSFDQEGYDGGTLHYFCYRNLKDLLNRTGFRVTMRRGIFCIPASLESLTDVGWIGRLKLEFLSGEILVRAVKLIQ